MWIFSQKNIDLNANMTLNDMANNYVDNATGPFRIESFSYENSVVMETMFKNLERTNFRGVSVSKLDNVMAITTHT